MIVKNLLREKVIFKQKGVSLFCFVCLVLSNVIETLGLVYVSKEIIELLLSKEIDRLLNLLLVMISMVVILATIKCAISLCSFRLKKNATVCIEDAAIDHIYRLRNWQIGYKHETYFVQIRSDIPDLVQKYLDTIQMAISMVMTIFLGTIYACYLEWRVYLLCVVLIVISYIITNKAYMGMPQIEKKAGELFNRNYTNVWQYVANSEIIPFLSFSKVTRDFDNTATENVENAIKKGKSYASVNISQKVINVGLVLIVCIAGAYLSVGRNDLTTYMAELTVLVVLIPQVASSFLSSYDWNLSRKEIQGICKRLDDFWKVEEYTDDHKKHDVLKQRIKEISLKNLSMAYERNRIISNLTFQFKKSNVYCIHGKSGCGKSTLIKLMCDVLQPDKDMVFFDDIDISQVHRDVLWDKISYVSQESYIFRDSIKKNIIMDENFDQERLDVACKISTLNNTFSQAEINSDTVVESTKLSSGEKQKICLARALYRNRDVLLLDEALSAMDPVSQHEVMERLISYVKESDTICIMVEHNEDLVPLTAKKLYMSGGVFV